MTTDALAGKLEADIQAGQDQHSANFDVGHKRFAEATAYLARITGAIEQARPHEQRPLINYGIESILGQDVSLRVYTDEHEIRIFVDPEHEQVARIEPGVYDSITEALPNGVQVYSVNGKGLAGFAMSALPHVLDWWVRRILRRQKVIR